MLCGVLTGSYQGLKEQRSTPGPRIPDVQSPKENFSSHYRISGPFGFCYPNLRCGCVKPMDETESVTAGCCPFTMPVISDPKQANEVASNNPQTSG